MVQVVQVSQSTFGVEENVGIAQVGVLGQCKSEIKTTKGVNAYATTG